MNMFHFKIIKHKTPDTCNTVFSWVFDETDILVITIMAHKILG